MTLGTKTLLFGVHQILVHQILVHPLMVLMAWVKIYRSFPTWRELVCIFIHDWGYWGMKSLKCSEGDKHPELGAQIANRIFGPKYRDFILGHSTFYTVREDISVSKLMAPDKYWHCMVPLWFYKCLSVPTGEFNHYRGLKHARQVSEDTEEPDWMWWVRLQIVCYEKMKGKYKIHKDDLHEKGRAGFIR